MQAFVFKTTRSSNMVLRSFLYLEASVDIAASTSVYYIVAE
jgi:hypothetical protein